MKRNVTLAVPGLAAAAFFAAAAFIAPALAQETSSTSPAPAAEVGRKPGEGADSKPADGKSAKPQTTSPAPVGEVGSKPGEGSDSKPGDASGAKPADGAPPPTSSRSTPQHFEPTEKVRPDFDVAFPIDI